MMTWTPEQWYYLKARLAVVKALGISGSRGSSGGVRESGVCPSTAVQRLFWVGKRHVHIVKAKFCVRGRCVTMHGE